MYQLRAVVWGKDKEIIQDIDNEVGDNLISYIKYLSVNMKSYFYYQIVKRNLSGLITFIEAQQNKTTKSDLVECNRLLFNFMDTFYAFINYFESNYKKEFESIKNNIYDKYFEYRFIYNLRNFIIHEDLGVLSETRQFNKDFITVQFNINLEKFSTSKRVQSKVREEIKDKFNKRNMDIYPILKKQYAIIKEIQERMILTLSHSILTKFNYLADKIINRNDTFLLKDGKIVNSLLNVTSKYYADIAKNFIYEEKYMDVESKIKDFFMTLSFHYYREPFVVYKFSKYNE